MITLWFRIFEIKIEVPNDVILLLFGIFWSHMEAFLEPKIAIEEKEKYLATDISMIFCYKKEKRMESSEILTQNSNISPGLKL